jgi:hypothetical protein
MNVVGIVVLASPPRDPIRSKRHNGRHLRAMHTYSAPTSPPPRSNKVRWSGRWDQQHDDVELMVESICGHGFAYARKVEEDRQKSSQTRARKSYKRDSTAAAENNFRSPGRALSSHIYTRPCLGVQVSGSLSSRPSKLEPPIHCMRLRAGNRPSARGVRAPQARVAGACA